MSDPNTYFDNLDVRNFSDDKRYPDNLLDGRIDQYAEFLHRTDIGERRRKVGERVLEHLLWELGYRNGVYEVDDCE